MNVYEVILKAAAHIESNPEQFAYDCSRVTRCGSPACAIGWIGFFANEPRGDAMDTLDPRTRRLLGVDYWHTFEQRMSELNRVWSLSALDCAAALRLYAAKYHAAAKRTDAELVSALMARVTSGERIPEDA